MAIADDLSVALNGDIRWTGTTATYTVLEVHRFLGGLADDEQASGDDLVDITSDTPSERSTDQIITLNPPYNIDDSVAEHLYNGSITQADGDTIYSGLRVLGVVESGTEIQIVQDGKFLPAYWGTGLNPDAANNVIMQLCIKSRVDGADIDGQKILTRAHELGDLYKEFSVTLGLSNSVSAISTAQDLNNGTADATIEGWSTITNTEGYQELDIDGTGAAGQDFWSQFATGSQSINDTYEWSKQKTQRAHIADSGTDTGTNYVVDDATTTGQGQEFTTRAVDEELREMRFRLKVGAGTPTGNIYAELYDSDDAATAAPVATVQAVVADDGGAQTDETTAANNATTNDMTLLPATPAVNDAYYFGADGKWPHIDLNVSTAGSGTWTITWEYYDGAAWQELSNVSDGTTGFTTGGTNRVSWLVPDDWETTTVNAQGPYYYVRARVSAYTSVTTAPIGQQVFKPLAVSQPVLATRLQTGYLEFIFRFEDEFTLTNSVEYFAVIRHPDGDASNYIHVEGAAAGADDGNKASEAGVGSWTGDTADLWFEVHTSPRIYGVAGELLRGITHDVTIDNRSGTFTETEIVYWGTDVTYDTLVGKFNIGEYVKFDNAGTIVNGGKVLSDSGTVLRVALEDTSGSTLADGYTITGLDSGTTADINTTITNQDKAGGEGILLADDASNVNLYIQILTGGAPTDNLQIVGRTSAATCDVNVTVTGRTIADHFIGQSTGTNIIGAYGIGFDPTDVGASDTFFDLSNTQRTPPNNVTFTVSGLVSGEDRVLVGPRTGSALNKAQMSLNTTLNATNETAIVATAAIPAGTPQDGSTTNTRLRVELDTGVFRRQAYTSHTGSTFTISSTDYSGANVATAANDMFVAYIDVLCDADTETYTAVHTTDVDVLVRVRDGGGTPIKTSETPSTFTSSPVTVAASRISDA